MLIQEIDNKTIWEGFLANVKEKTFLHSWDWGQFQEMTGERIWRLGVYESDELFAAALVIKVSSRRGNFLFIPHGPIIRNQEEMPNLTFQILQELTSELGELARQEKCSFLRISPIVEDNEEHRTIFKNLGFRFAPMHMHAELTWILDISEHEEDVLMHMRKTTRNLIRRGEREGVEVMPGTLADFYDLYQETVKRQQFVPFAMSYLQKELDAFGDNAQIFVAKYDGNILAGALVVFFDTTAYYHHGASTHSDVPAAYSLQWEIIKEAKKRGIKQYNFWGVVPESDTNHPWWGLSLFKRGFGGHEWNLLHAQDLPLSWKYYISWGIEKARKWKRGY